MWSEMPDEELMGLIRQRIPEALESLMLRYKKPIHRHLESILRDAALADDLVQEVFLRVWTRADSWSGQGSPKAWLFSIATNQSLNAIRSQRRRREQAFGPSQLLKFEKDQADMVCWLDRPDTQGPEGWVELTERQEQLRQAIDQLPPGKAAVVRLIYEQDLSPHEIAEVLGIPPGTVRSRLHHARRQLENLCHDVEEG